MAERSRRFFPLRRRATDEDTERLNALLNAHNTQTVDWDGKALASLSKIGMSTRSGSTSSGQRTEVSYDLLRSISLKSEVVNAILRCTVNDTIGNGYEFVLKDGVETGNEQQLQRLLDFFTTPNPDDSGDEWLESLIYDLQLFGDAYLELDGSADRSNEDETEWTYGGDLQAVWPVPAEQIRLLPGNQRPAPPAMAYVQSVNKEERRFSADKIVHVSKFKHGRGYGTSPLIPLLNTIAAHLNLSNYLGELYTGTLPKTILNVGDISNSEMKAMLALLEQQLAGGKSPFGLVAINGGTGFNMHRLLDSTREGAQLDLLFYYREEICAVFGIPPIKLGWVQTGKLANPETQLDSWYDVIESVQNRIEAMLNRKVIPLLGVSDWEFRFRSIRPSREKELAEVVAEKASAISNLRQEATISINEARAMLGLERLEQGEADDPFFISPKLQINQPNTDGGSSAEPPAEGMGLEDLFPADDAPEDEGKGAGDLVLPLVEAESSLDPEAKSTLAMRRKQSAEEFESLIAERSEVYLRSAEAEQSRFADEVIGRFQELFGPNDELVVEPGTGLRSYRSKATVTLEDIETAIIELDTAITDSVVRHEITGQLILTDSYGASLELTLGGTGIAASLNEADVAALAYWERRWTLPALRKTLGAHRSAVIKVFEQMIDEGRAWDWAWREMRKTIDPSGSAYPRYFYTRIARTETRRVVENSHLSGLRRAGFAFVQRLVTVDDVTDKDLCAPYEDAVYPADEATGVVPAHPNCRCTFVAYDGDAPSEVVPNEDILRPDVEGAEI